MKLLVLAWGVAALSLGGCSITTLPASKPLPRRAVAPESQSVQVVAVAATFDLNVMTGRQCDDPMVVPPLPYKSALKLVKNEGGNVLVVYRSDWPTTDTDGSVYGKHVRCPEEVLAKLRSTGKVNEP